jgi:hypothetical protein
MPQVKPYFVRFHEAGHAYPFLVTSEGDQDPGEEDLGQVSGHVFVIDAAGSLSVGPNTRTSIGRGGPGKDGSWSPYPEDEEA